MKIAFVEYFLNLQLEGGSMFSLDLYAKELTKRGHDISVITIISSKNDLGESEKKPYRMIEENIDNSNPIKTDHEAQGILKKYEDQFDVYHVHNPWLLTAAAAYRKNGGNTPVVVDMNTYMFCTNFALMDGNCHKNCRTYERVMHSDLPFLKKIMSIPIRAYQQKGLELTKKYIDMYFPVSPFAEKIFTEYGLDAGKMMMIPDGFDFSVFKSRPKATDQKLRVFNIVSASRFDYTKGVDIVIKAVAELKKRGINIILHHVGNDGNQKEKIIDLIKTLKIKNNIILHGHVRLKELLEIYANAKLFVHPARWFETFGRTVVEAMAMSLPVVVSDKGALVWVADGACLVFESGNHVDLADKIEKIYSDENLQSELSKKALKRAKDFDVSKTISGFIKAYNKLVQNI